MNYQIKHWRPDMKLRITEDRNKTLQRAKNVKTHLLETAAAALAESTPITLLTVCGVKLN